MGNESLNSDFRNSLNFAGYCRNEDKWLCFPSPALAFLFSIATKPAWAVGRLVARASDSRPEGLATRELLVTDYVILNHGRVTWTAPELAPPSPNYHTNGRTFQLSTDLAYIAALHGGSLVVLGSNS
ncbi:hypothetical protein TNCV_1240201 [Trichonephila clavipes]|uniref:Uncharacterized protein n=1 Tax=Trichonephila clavipes TaxID=2585209 RepID=A0A8X7BK10_TRICX|nr:hypothetical protein TNCV_1240201 [Trichonephila clavipes]